MDHPNAPSKPGPSGLNAKQLAAIAAALSAANLGLDVYREWFAAPAPTPSQIVAQLQATNRYTGEELQKISKLLPSWAKK